MEPAKQMGRTRQRHIELISSSSGYTAESWVQRTTIAAVGGVSFGKDNSACRFSKWYVDGNGVEIVRMS